MAYMMEDRLKDAIEEADKERALKDVVEATVKKKDKAVENAEERTRAAKRAQALADQKVVETEVKLGGTKLKLAKAESLNLANVKEIAKLRMALEASQDKWYSVGFVDAKNSVEPIIYQSRQYRFGEGWMAALQAMGVLKDSPLRNPNQIPYPDPPPPIQNPTGAEEEKDTPSMKELIREIDSYVELIDLEITSNPSALSSLAQPQLPDPNVQPPMILVPVQPNQTQDPIA